jgi:hypothetical protein
LQPFPDARSYFGSLILFQRAVDIEEKAVEPEHAKMLNL